MTIRLTTPEAFDAVLENLKRETMYSEEANSPFFKYCVADIREALAKGEDEYYLDVDWHLDSATCKVVMVIGYYKRSDIMTDVEYLKEDENERD